MLSALRTYKRSLDVSLFLRHFKVSIVMLPALFMPLRGVEVLSGGAGLTPSVFFCSSNCML